MRQIDRSAAGKAKLVAPEWWNASRVSGRGGVKVITGVEGGVTNELEKRAVEPAGPGTGVNVGEPGSPAAHLRRQPAGSRIDSLHRVHVEVGKCRSTHLRIADVCPVHCER